MIRFTSIFILALCLSFGTSSNIYAMIIGGPCDVSAECVGIPDVTSTCEDGACTCLPGYIKQDDLFDCLEIIHTVGGACKEPKQCQQGSLGSSSDCINEMCTCTNEAVGEPGDTACYPKREEIGDPCVVDVQCKASMGDHAVCKDGKNCDCDAESVAKKDNKFCLPIINSIELDTCEETPQCTEGLPGKLSECTENNTCSCYTNATYEIGKNICHLKAEEVNGPCEVHIQCTASLGDLSRCDRGNCGCPPHLAVPSEDQKNCLKIVHVIGNEECLENHQCTQGNPGEFSECVEKIPENATLPLNNTKTCECTSEGVSEPDGNICYEKATSVGNDCTVHDQCTANLGNYSECLDNGECACKPESVPSEKREKCLALINLIGGECEEQHQCTGGLPGPSSDCVLENGGKICKCTDAAVTEVNVCMDKATIVGDRCNVTQQCTANLGGLSECLESEKVCDCKPGSKPSVDNRRCVSGGVYIGGPCDDDNQCVGEPGSSSCVSGKCYCKLGYTSSNKLDDCLEIMNEIGETCKEIQQCQQGDLGELSDCFEIDSSRSICNCTLDATTSPGDNLCRTKAVFVGDTCVRESQCVANLVYSQCLGGKCTCKGDAVESSDKTKCLLKSLLGQTCDDDNQCNWIIGSSCVGRNESSPIEDKICQCDLEYISPPGVINACYPVAQLIGHPCELQIQCKNLNDSICLPEEKICGCNNETQVVSSNRNKCLERVNELNSTCVESIQCMTPDSECYSNSTQVESQCKCKRNDYIESQNPQGKCLKVVNEERMSCEEQQQCTSGLGPFSECRDGYCFCRSSFEYYEGGCYNPANLGGICNADEECKVGVNNLTHCEARYCRCVEGSFDFGNMCYATKYVGETCSSVMECTVSIEGAVTCDPLSKRCSCQYGYVPAMENRICVNGALKLYVQSNVILLTLIVTFFQVLYH